MHMTDKAHGALLLTASAFFFALMSVFVRLSGDLPLFQKAVFRNGVAMLAAWAAIRARRTPIRVPRSAVFPLSVRIAAGTGAVLCNYYAIGHMALASSNALSKMSPFFAILFAAVFLREKVGRGELVCILIALSGGLLLLAPDLHSMDTSALIGLTGGILTGMTHTALRAMRKDSQIDGNVIVFLFSLISLIFMAVPAIFIWKPMSAAQTVYLLLAGSACSVAQFTLTAAYRYAAPNEISICDYSQVVFSAGFGFLLFSQVPGAVEMAAYALIALASAILFILYRPRSGDRTARSGR